MVLLALPEELAADKELAMAAEELRRINADEHLRAMIEQQEKAERDRRWERKSELKQVREQSLAEGREEGRKEGRGESLRTVAEAMLKAGQTPEFIARMTGLPLEKIRRMEDQNR